MMIMINSGSDGRFYFRVSQVIRLRSPQPAFCARMGKRGNESQIQDEPEGQRGGEAETGDKWY